MSKDGDTMEKTILLSKVGVVLTRGMESQCNPLKYNTQISDPKKEHILLL